MLRIKLNIFSSILVVIAFTSQAYAVIYTYQGPIFTMFTPAYNGTEHMSAVMTLNQPLLPNISGYINLNLQQGFSLKLTDGYKTLSTNGSLIVNDCAILSTDINGLPSEWTLNLSAETLPEHFVNFTTSLQNSQQWDMSQTVILTGGIENAWYSANPVLPDSSGWNVQQSTVPEPATLLLLGVGIVGLVIVRKNKSTH